MRLLLVAASLIVLACGSKPPPTAPPSKPPSDPKSEPAIKPQVQSNKSAFRVTVVDASPGSASVDGVLRDRAAREPLVGATIVFSSPALQGEQVVLTDEQGRFAVLALPAGPYTMTVYYEDMTFENKLDVADGKRAQVAFDVDLQSQRGQTIVVDPKPVNFATASEALKVGALEQAYQLGKKELAKGESSRLHGMLAIAKWGSAIVELQMRMRPDDKMASDKLRQPVVQLLADLDTVQGHLAAASKDPAFTLDLCIACMAVDDSTYLPVPPGLFDLERDRAGKPLPEGDPRRRPTYRFDHGDLAWAKAMVSYQQALVNIALAYDWKFIDELMKDDDTARKMTIKLIEPARVAKAREQLLGGLVASAEARAEFLAETDDEREWVPNPKQKSYASPLPVDAKLYKTWESILGDIQALVAGKTGLSFEAIGKLVGVKGAPKGFIDLGAMLSTPKDIVWDLGALDRLEREKNAGKRVQLATTLFKQLLGNGYKAKMKPSPLTDRLLQLRKDFDGGAEQAGEDKLKYFFWLN